jgi:hypothetical protein
MARKLTEQQERFLEYLFDEAGGDAVKAKKLAGYSHEYATSSIIKTLEEEIIERTKLFLSRNGPKAAVSIANALDDPTELGIKEKLAAAKDILDRIGVVKTEKIQFESGLFILPPKKFEESDDA